MADVLRKPSKRIKRQARLEAENTVKLTKNSTKSAKRRQRRKRSKSKYYRVLKKRRTNKTTEDLCSAINLFDVTDMDWSPNHGLNHLPLEVSEWQKQDQIAYWKSRAISLEIENRMLHQHLRNVYAKQIEDYAGQSEWVDIKKDESEAGPSKEMKKDKVMPKIPEGKERAEEMRKIYGDRAQKIMGMETAIQLNYERHVEGCNTPFWPNLPIKL
ncbi:gem-associated protein 8-like [Cylas formicarius]|uniref:gem-associated protein 8-like n=1 Tax=Cylas formicarius TaxID=197179 RepID=UPI00295879ED|nr:gem-associated protein 8-like [Cylas formicarius]XP_060533143.1 gem-associated protein 8-like [Cylas formicarius]